MDRKLEPCIYAMESSHKFEPNLNYESELQIRA